MSFGKIDISNDISSKAQISSDNSKEILKKFLHIIITKSKSSNVKIHNFGTFLYKNTPKRLGRNPKTKEEYIISKRSKLSFKPSNKIRNIIN